MTAAPNSPAVTREDREAYIALRGIGEGKLAEAIRSGWYDQENAGSYAILARHRLAASTPGAERIGDTDAQRILAEASVDCGCRIPSPFDEVAEHAIVIAEAKGFERGKAFGSPAAVERGEVARATLMVAVERNWNHGPDALVDAILSALSRDGGKA